MGDFTEHSVFKENGFNFCSSYLHGIREER